MRMKIALWLPRTVESVSVARHSLDRILTVFGVRPDCRAEIALAVTEACGNAVRHAAGPAVYELAAESEGSECTITIGDHGPGLPDAQPHAMPESKAISGRGFALMRSTTDGVEVQLRNSGGLTVRLFKHLRWTDRAFGCLTP